MDKLREFFRTFKRIHFWVVCGSIVVLGVTVWMLTTDKLQEERDKNLGTINQSYTTLIEVSGVTPHPNDTVRTGMQQLIDSRRAEIREAWEAKLEQQKEIFTWSEELGGENSGFMQTVKDLLPIERQLPFPITSEQERNLLGSTQKNLYRNHVDLELPRLANSIKANWTGGRDRQGGMNPNAPVWIDDPVVDWDLTNQKALIDQHFPWASGGQSGAQLTTLDIMYAQEDLWVLKALLSIIEKTNGDATTQHNAQIRKIEFIRIGKDAVLNEATLVGGNVPPANPMGDGTQTAPPPVASDAEPGEGGDNTNQFDPAQGRYVDRNYQPLSAQKLREVMQAESNVAPEDAYLAVAKRIPIRMRVTMDQRQVNRLLVECANSRPTVEVRQLRIDDPTSKKSGSRSLSTTPYRENELRDGGGSGAGIKSDPFPHDLSVEVYGIVYIYNPVNDAVLGGGTGTDPAADEPTTPVSTFP